MKRVTLRQVPEEGVSHNPEIKKQVLFRKGDLPHLTSFSRSRLKPGQVSRAHRHADMYEVFFVESGAGAMTVNGQDEQLEPGVCIAVEPGDEHEITNTGTSDLVLLYFGIEE
jgi:mannose-6-phosphate isomerase-like protein (cupin superfamily)